MSYSDLERIGRGGFAKVYKVQDDNGNQFAKKVFSPLENLVENVGNDHLKRRFVREVQYQMTIDHPNVVKIIDVNLDVDEPFFIMPLAINTLKKDLDEDHTLGENCRVALFDILSGLEIIHDKGFVHRDLKPANILKYEQEGVFVYKISDFGLISCPESDSSTLTGTNARGGSEDYAAPELNGGFRRATSRADIYSFGAILNDIFGNRIRRIPYTHITNVSGRIGEIISKCTTRRPSTRYESISHLREELYDVLNNETTTFHSNDEEHIVNLLTSNENLSLEQWDEILLLLEEENISRHNIYRSISANHIRNLMVEPDLFNDLGLSFSDFIKENSFSFDYCDVLAGKAQLFFDEGSLSLKASIAVSLLILGTSHNRWYVEEKFVSMTRASSDPYLIERIKTEFVVNDIDFNRHINHLLRSIGRNIDIFHSILIEYYNENLNG